MSGIVAYKPHHREIIRQYFLPACSDSRGVSPTLRVSNDILTTLKIEYPNYLESDAVYLGMARLL
jgi:hypothetical protein